MKIKPMMAALLAVAGFTLAGGALAQTTSKDTRDMSFKNAAAIYKADSSACDVLSGNAKDICTEEAKGKEKIAKADAEVVYANTPKSRENARVARADAMYEVAKEKCDDLAGNPKDVCVKEAKANQTRATQDAKVDRVTTDTRANATEKIVETRRDATDVKRDADYKVAVEKCDALAGATKDNCVLAAKSQFGKG